jgi:hypothetical protein
MAKDVPASVTLRQLFSELAVLMQSVYTFKAIADKFYETGVIDEPESPWKDG